MFPSRSFHVVIAVALGGSSLAGATDRDADAGGDFTYEVRLRGSIADENARVVTGVTRWELSLEGGRCAFGVMNEALDHSVLRSRTVVLDGEWHHVVAARRRSDGFLWLWIDGRLEASADGPDGELVPGPPGRGSELPPYAGSIEDARLRSGLHPPGSVDEDIRGLPRGAVFEAYSNPDLGQTILFARFPEDRAGRAAVTIHDANGGERTRLEGTIRDGSVLIVWDGTDRGGAPLPPGVYSATLVADRTSSSIELRLP